MTKWRCGPFRYCRYFLSTSTTTSVTMVAWRRRRVERQSVGLCSMISWTSPRNKCVDDILPWWTLVLESPSVLSPSWFVRMENVSCTRQALHWIPTEKKRSGEPQRLRAGCSKTEPKDFTPPQTPFPGAHDGQNLISLRWSLPSPTDPVWWGSMHAKFSSYRGNRPTHRQDRLQLHCAAASTQCKE